MSTNQTTAPLKVWDYEQVRARCHELCKLADGSPCQGPETNCTPDNCFAMEQAAREFGYDV